MKVFLKTVEGRRKVLDNGKRSAQNRPRWLVARIGEMAELV